MAKWRRTKHLGEALLPGTKHAYLSREEEWKIAGRMGGGTGRSGKHGSLTSMALLRLSEHRSGSPAPAFGFTEEEESAGMHWPALTLEVSFIKGREDQREALAAKLRAVVAEFAKEQGLFPPEEES